MLGTVIVLLSLVGHAAGQGMLPSLPGLITCAVIAFAVAYAVAGRRLPTVAVFGLLVASEAVLHVVMSATSHHHGSSLSLTMVLAHLAAAGVATGVIERGEDLAARWLAFITSTLGSPLLPFTRAAELKPVPVVARCPRHTADCLCHAVVRRGPPKSDSFWS